MRYTREEYAPLDVRAAWPALPLRAESVESRDSSARLSRLPFSSLVLACRILSRSLYFLSKSDLTIA